MGFARRLMRQVGPYVTPDASIVAIEMATSPGVDPAGPVSVVVTDAEILLVASGSDGGHLTKIAANDIAGVDPSKPTFSRSQSDPMAELSARSFSTPVLRSHRRHDLEAAHAVPAIRRSVVATPLRQFCAPSVVSESVRRTQASLRGCRWTRTVRRRGETLQGAPMTLTDRRAFPRYDAPATWAARYLVEGCSDLDWQDCRVLDISRGGAALEIAPEDTVEGIVALELYAFGDAPRNIALSGEVRHSTHLPSGAKRVGLEFVGISASEEQLLALLLRLVEVS
jgi:PilZ domain